MASAPAQTAQTSTLLAAGALAALAVAGLWWAARGAAPPPAPLPATAEMMRPYAREAALLAGAPGDARRRPAGWTGAAGLAALPAPVPAPGNPLQPLLDRAVHAGAPGTRADAAADADATADEIRGAAQFVVARVNEASPRAGLALVAVESARKAVDAYKTVRYDLVLNVFSTRLTVAARLAATVVAAGGSTYLAAARAEAGVAAPDPAAARQTVAGSLGPAAEEDYAGFEPVI